LRGSDQEKKTRTEVGLNILWGGLCYSFFSFSRGDRGGLGRQGERREMIESLKRREEKRRAKGKEEGEGGELRRLGRRLGLVPRLPTV